MWAPHRRRHLALRSLELRLGVLKFGSCLLVGFDIRGKPIEPGEDYVAAREYEASPDFSLHTKGHDVAPRATRHFHVEHFRWHIGDAVYELVREEASQ